MQQQVWSVKGEAYYYCTCPACNMCHVLEINQIVIAYTKNTAIKMALNQAADSKTGANFQAFGGAKCEATIVEDQDAILS